MTDNQAGAAGENSQESHSNDLGDQILNLLGENCKDPGEAFTLLQQLTIYVWDQYKVEWSSAEDHPVASSRKQRYLDYVNGMIEALSASKRLSNSID